MVVDISGEMITYLLPIMAVVMFSIVASVLYDIGQGINAYVFLLCMATGICILVWAGGFPVWFLTISGLLLLSMIFIPSGDNTV
jgi:hypothetical protein